jgi:hypothetical protein
MGITEQDLLQQLLVRPLSPVSYVLQVFLIGAALSIGLRLAPARMRLTILIFALSFWFAALWFWSLPRCGDFGFAVMLAALFAAPAMVSGFALLTNEPMRAPWTIGSVLVIAHLVHFGVTWSFRAVVCL